MKYLMLAIALTGCIGKLKEEAREEIREERVEIRKCIERCTDSAIPCFSNAGLCDEICGPGKLYLCRECDELYTQCFLDALDCAGYCIGEEE